jgi:hypothetical protein
MARRGDALYLRGKTWYLNCSIKGTRYQRRLDKGISRSVALELAQVQRAAILKGELGIGKKAKDLAFAEARKKFEGWIETEKRPNTVRRYKQCLVQLARAFGDKRLSLITPWVLEHYKKERVAGAPLTERPPALSDKEWARRSRLAAAGSPIGVNRELAVLKALYNDARPVHSSFQNPMVTPIARSDRRFGRRAVGRDSPGSRPIRSGIPLGRGLQCPGPICEQFRKSEAGRPWAWSNAIVTWPRATRRRRWKNWLQFHYGIHYGLKMVSSRRVSNIM